MALYQGLEVIIDWLEFTVMDTSLKDVIDRILNLPFSEFSPLEKGRFGYQNQLKWKTGHVYVMFTAIGNEINEDVQVRKETGIHVMITGQGCKQYSVNNSLQTLLRFLSAQEKVNFSRVDLAIDDYESKIINYDKIHKSAIRGHFTSRWSKWDEVNSRQSSTGEFLGRTMYFGSQASDLFCRIYDKTLERKANSEQETEIPKKWTRLELVYRKDRAKKVVEYLVKGEKPLGHVLRGTLRRYLRFLIPSTDQNKARWPSAKWWDRLLSNVEELQLTIQKEPKSIEDMTAWVDKQISPTIAAIMKAQEGDMGWLRKIILKGSTRLTQKHLDAISTYQGSLNYD